MTLNLGGNEVAITQVFDGTKGWLSFAGNTQELDKEMMAEAREQMHAGQVADLRGLDDKGVKLSPLGESKLDGKTAVGVRVSAEGYRDISLFFDRDTGLLLKSEKRAKDPMSGEEFTEEKRYADYKKVNGLMVPHKQSTKRDGKPHADIELTEVTVAEKLPDNTFAKP